ncbi:MAG: family 43 glycosylhydrolase [Paludibacter sp.]
MKIYFLITLIFSSMFVYSNSPKIDVPVMDGKCTSIVTACDSSFNIDIKDFKMRDPFVFVDTIGKSYFIQSSSNDNKSFTVFESNDLKKWKNLGKSFEASSDFWGKQDFWAPDMFLYNGKYYIVSTFSSSTVTRGCGILVSDYPQGPYVPLVNNPITPSGWRCCDGTLLIDNGEPYLLYASSHKQFGLGYIYIQKLSTDLKTMAGEPILITKAADASWVKNITVKGVVGLVGDSPFIYRTAENELIMLWSSFSLSNGKYCIGVARSASGLVIGPWVHDAAPLNDDDGGHAMIFKSFEGKTKISYHATNSHPSYVTISDFEVNKGIIKITK